MKKKISPACCFCMKMSSSPAFLILFGSITHISLTYVICFILICVFFIDFWHCSFHSIHTVHNQACKDCSTRECWTSSTENWSSLGSGSDEVSQEQHQGWGSWWSQRKAHRSLAWCMSAVCCGNRGSKQIDSPLHVRKVLSLSNKRVCWTNKCPMHLEVVNLISDSSELKMVLF